MRSAQKLAEVSWHMLCCWYSGYSPLTFVSLLHKQVQVIKFPPFGRGGYFYNFHPSPVITTRNALVINILHCGRYHDFNRHTSNIYLYVCYTRMWQVTDDLRFLFSFYIKFPALIFHYSINSLKINQLTVKDASKNNLYLVLFQLMSFHPAKDRQSVCKRQPFTRRKVAYQYELSPPCYFNKCS